MRDSKPQGAYGIVWDEAQAARNLFFEQRQVALKAPVKCEAPLRQHDAHAQREYRIHGSVVRLQEARRGVALEPHALRAEQHAVGPGRRAARRGRRVFAAALQELVRRLEVDRPLRERRKRAPALPLAKELIAAQQPSPLSAPVLQLGADLRVRQINPVAAASQPLGEQTEAAVL